MTDIEALRARMREAAVAVENAQPAPRDPVFSDPQLEAMELFRALASPANVKALDAEITRLREDLDRVTRERDEALAYVKDATVAITELTSGGSEFFGKRIAGIYTADLPFCVQRIRETRAGQFEHIRKLARELKSAEAALAKRDEEVARLREALEHIRNLDEADGHDLTWQHASEAVGLAHQALTKEPTNAE